MRFCALPAEMRLVGWHKNQKAIGHQVCRQHYLVDVAMFGPSADASIIGVAPERLDLLAEGYIAHQRLELCA